MDDNETSRPGDAAESLMNAIFGVEQEQDDGSFWDALVPNEVTFFSLPMLDRLRGRPYHMASLTGKFDLKALARDYAAHVFRSELTLRRKEAARVRRLLLLLEGQTAVLYEGEELRVYAPDAHSATQTAEAFERYRLAPPSPKPRFYLVSIASDGTPHTQDVLVDRPCPMSEADLELHYGDDLPPWERAWLERLRQRPSGVSVLYGETGCGKTTYLRTLLARLLDASAWYYLPIWQVPSLSDPRLVGFWLDQQSQHEGKSLITIIEDAEELLLPRDKGNRDKVSNLLNIGDGFLGDFLKMHIIATTNTHLDELDPAVMRPGRLLGTREFRRLTRQEAARLAQAKGLILPDQPDYSLAEIYCQNALAEGELKRPRQIGFA
jgi:hypothetical protein